MSRISYSKIAKSGPLAESSVERLRQLGQPESIKDSTVYESVTAIMDPVYVPGVQHDAHSGIGHLPVAYDVDPILPPEPYTLQPDPVEDVCSFPACLNDTVCTLRQHESQQMCMNGDRLCVEFTPLMTQVQTPFNPTVDFEWCDVDMSMHFDVYDVPYMGQKPLEYDKPTDMMRLFAFPRKSLISKPQQFLSRFPSTDYTPDVQTTLDRYCPLYYIGKNYKEMIRQPTEPEKFCILRDLFQDRIKDFDPDFVLCMFVSYVGIDPLVRFEAAKPNACLTCGGAIPTERGHYWWFPLTRHCTCRPLQPISLSFKVPYSILLNYSDAFQRAPFPEKKKILSALKAPWPYCVHSCGQLGPMHIKELGTYQEYHNQLYLLFLCHGISPFVFTQKSLAEFAYVMYQESVRPRIGKPGKGAPPYAFVELMANLMRLKSWVRFTKSLHHEPDPAVTTPLRISICGKQIFSHYPVYTLENSKIKESQFEFPIPEDLPEVEEEIQSWRENTLWQTSDLFRPPEQESPRLRIPRQIAEIDMALSGKIHDIFTSEVLWNQLLRVTKHAFPNLTEFSNPAKDAMAHLFLYYITDARTSVAFHLANAGYKKRMLRDEVVILDAMHGLFYLGHVLASWWMQPVEELQAFNAEELREGMHNSASFFSVFLPGGMGSLRTMMEELRLYSLARTLALDIFAAIRAILTWIVEYFRKNVMGVQDEYEAFISAVDDLREVYYDENGHSTTLRVQMVKDGLLRDKVMSLLTLGTQLKRKLEKTKASKELMKQVNDRVTRINKIVSGSSASFVGAEGKLKPFTVYLYGEPGSGKSVMLPHLFKDLCYTMGAAEFDKTRDMYVMTAKTGYHDQYAYQRFAIRNDVLQMRDDQMRVNEIYDLINMADETPYPLEIAECQGKGQVYFTSPYLFMTSNFDVHSRLPELTSHMTEPDALIRRLDMIVEVVKGDYSMCNGFDRQAMRFRILSKDGHEESHVTWYGLVNEMVNRILKQYHRSFGVNAMQFTDYDKDQLDRIRSIQLGIPTPAQQAWIERRDVPCSSYGSTDVQAPNPMDGADFEAPEIVLPVGQKHYVAMDQAMRIERSKREEVRKELDAMVSKAPSRRRRGKKNSTLARVVGPVGAQTSAPDESLIETVKSMTETCEELSEMVKECQLTEESEAPEADPLDPLPPPEEAEAWLPPRVAKTVEYCRDRAYGTYDTCKDKAHSALLRGPGLWDRTVEICTTWSPIPEPTRLERWLVGLKTILPSSMTELAEQHVLMYDFYSPLIRAGLFVGGLVTAWMGIEFILRKFRKHAEVEQKFMSTSGGSHEFPNNKPNRAAVRRHRPLARREFAQAAVNEMTGWQAPNGQLLEQAIYKNLVVVLNGECRTNGLYIADHILMLPLHLFRDLDNETIQIILHGGVVVTIHMSEVFDEDTFIVERHHLVFLNTKRWTRHYPQWSHLGRFFISDMKNEDFRCELGQMFTYRSSMLTTVGVFQRAQIEQVTPATGAFMLKSATSNDRYPVERSIRGKVNSVTGDCGAPWVLDHQTGAKIAGIHISNDKSTNTGRAAVVTKEMIDQVLQHFTVRVLPIQNEAAEETAQSGQFSLTEEEFYDCEDTLCLDLIGQTKKTVHQPSKSDLAHTSWYGITPVTKVPAKLKPFKDPETKKYIRPTVVRFKKWFGHSTRIPVDKIYEVFPYLSEWYPRPPADKRRVLTIEQAIFGENDGYNPSIEQNKSVGWPWKEKLRSRKDFFNIEERWISDELREAVDNYLQGVLPDTVVLDALKDERVKIAKAECGDTRVFTICDFTLNIALKMLFGDFVHYMQSRYSQAPVKMGISPLPGDWTELYDYLNDNAGGIIAGDMSGWDHRCHFEVMMGVVEWINEWYDDEYSEIRYELARMTFEPLHLCDGSLYRSRAGMPSGSYLTTPCNSLAVLTYLYMFALDMTGGDLGSDHMLWFRPAVYGDDHLVAVAEHPEINQQSLCQWFADVGVIYTDENKNVPNRPYTNLEEATFLKRNFVRRDGYVWGPLPVKNLYEQVQWYRRTATQRVKGKPKLHEEVLDTVLNEAFFHGPQIYNEMKANLMEYIKDKDLLDVSNGAPPYRAKWRQFMTCYVPPPLTRLELNPCAV